MNAEVRSLESKRKRKVLLNRIRYALLVLASAAAIYLFFFSTTFAVKSVSVIGSYYATQEEIVAAARIDAGLPMARLDAHAIQQRVLALSEVRTVEVRRAWPNSVVLAVVERAPIAVTKLKDQWKYVAKDGVVFGHAATKPAQFLSVSARQSETFAAAAKVAAALPDWLRTRVVEIEGLSRDDVVIWLEDGIEIKWGSSEQSDYKAKVLQALLGQNARMYNVSVPDRPAIRK